MPMTHISTPPLPHAPQPAAPPRLHHGGRLREAARQYRITLDDWLDLSTGINPHGYPPPPVPAEAWLRLPEDDDGLERAAADHYGLAGPDAPCRLLPVAGSQAAIQTLSRLIPARQVCLFAPSYAEHAHAWRTSERHYCTSVADMEAALPQADVVVVVNPNNPCGRQLPAAQLLDWRRRLAHRGGWLIVDEAFADARPEHSLAPHAGLPGLVVLRSLGKFFGLAGARVGFVLGEPALLARLAALLGPWTLAGPARHVATAALRDTAWQARTRQQLATSSARLAELLTHRGLTPSGGTALFQWLRTAQADALHQHCARQGILLRHFDTPASLRFGLPPDERGWQRLATALDSWSTPPAPAPSSTARHLPASRPRT